MKPLFRHVLIALAGGSAGWFSGFPDAPILKNIAEKPHPATVKLTGLAPAPTVESEIDALRLSPGAGVGTNWVKWATTVGDAEIPRAIASLRVNADFDALRLLYSRWVKLDPDAAWASFRHSGIPETAATISPRIDHDLMQTGFVKVTTYHTPRSLIASAMISAWMTVDKQGSLALLAKLNEPGSIETKEFGMQGHHLARLKMDQTPTPLPPPPTVIDHSNATAEALALPPGAERKEALNASLNQWLRGEPAAAVAWLARLPADARSEISIQVIQSIDPALPKLRLDAFCELASKMASFEDGSIGGDLVRSSTRRWAGEDPAAVRAYLKALPAGEAQSFLTGQAAGVMVGKDPNAAIEMVNQLPGDQRHAIAGLVDGWVQQDATACIAWLGKINDPSVTDSCYETIATRLSAVAPREAFEAALKIADPAIKRDRIYSLKQSLSWNPKLLRQVEQAQ